MAAETARNRAALRLLLLTSRPALEPFFRELQPGGRPASVVCLDARADALTGRDEELEAAEAAVVDVGLDPAAAVPLCRELHRRRPSLPVAALVCCPPSVRPWTLRTLIAGGVTSVLDLEAGQAETERALDSLAKGGSVLNVHLRRGQRAFLRDALLGEEPRDARSLRLLELVALGLSDREIGNRMHFSPHTVKHQIEQLRRALGARNRVELAAWAGSNGFYAPEQEQADSVPVRIARGRR